MTTVRTPNINKSQRHSDNIGKGALRMEASSSQNTEVIFTSLFIIKLNIISGKGAK